MNLGFLASSADQSQVSMTANGVFLFIATSIAPYILGILTQAGFSGTVENAVALIVILFGLIRKGTLIVYKKATAQ